MSIRLGKWRGARKQEEKKKPKKLAQKAEKKSWWRRLLRFLWRFSLWSFLASLVLVILLRFVPVVLTPLMLIRYFEPQAAGKKAALRADWEPLEKISENLQKAVVASEDQLFYQHHGFDLKAIEKAWKQNKKSKRTRGASTISQQTAKNVFLWPQRSWLRKGLELYFTGAIELIWGKQRILEVYLNVAELGPGVYGAEAASRYYFKKSAAKLTAEEAAMLAAILPNPRKWNPLRPSPHIRKKQAWILRQIRRSGDLFEPPPDEDEDEGQP